MERDSNEVARLARMLRERQPAVVLTGAGISTESGIPDFRSPSGIWAEFDPAEYASIEAFRGDPEKVWGFYAARIEMLVAAKPNAAHFALAELERLGLLRAVVTQNVDLLHERAGSQEVVEVHGSIRTSTCLQCETSYELPRVVQMVEHQPGEAPRCSSCAAVLKPDVVFFGELLPEREIDRAFALARSAALLLVVGSTLEVYPVADMPRETVQAGGDVAIVNRGPTAFDRRAALRIEGAAGDVLPAVVEALELGS